jgi:hypothetical protein
MSHKNSSLTPFCFQTRKILQSFFIASRINSQETDNLLRIIHDAAGLPMGADGSTLIDGNEIYCMVHATGEPAVLVEVSAGEMALNTFLCWGREIVEHGPAAVDAVKQLRNLKFKYVTTPSDQSGYALGRVVQTDAFSRVSALPRFRAKIICADIFSNRKTPTTVK